MQVNNGRSFVVGMLASEMPAEQEYRFRSLKAIGGHAADVIHSQEEHFPKGSVWHPTTVDEATVVLQPDFKAGCMVWGHYFQLQSRIALHTGQRTLEAAVDACLCQQVSRPGAQQRAVLL